MNKCCRTHDERGDEQRQEGSAFRHRWGCCSSPDLFPCALRWLLLRRRPAPSPVTAISAAIIAAAAALFRTYFFVVATRVRARGDQPVELRHGCECSVVPSPSPIPLPSPSAKEGRQAARCIETMTGDWGGRIHPHPPTNAIPIVHDDGIHGEAIVCDDHSIREETMIPQDTTPITTVKK
jgi:hypothetical protein